MPLNHLEQFVAEWLEYSGYFVRRNVKVGKREKGGYGGELDVVALHPRQKRLLHYEMSTDTDSWPERERSFGKTFDAGRRHIPGLFEGLALPNRIEQYAVFLYGSDANHKTVGGGTVLMMDDFLKEMVSVLRTKRIAKGIVPEQYPLLRVLHLACEFRRHLIAVEETRLS